MDERARRIVDTAIELAERDGFAAVRLRDVAAQAEVALGTVYKRFSSKEDILIAALGVEAERLAGYMLMEPVEGDTALARVTEFFRRATGGLTEKPNLARALVRAMTSAGGEIHGKIASFHALTTMMIIATIRGISPNEPGEWGGAADEDARRAARVLQHVWFASMVGWAGGIHDIDQVLADVTDAADLLLRNIR